MNQNVKAAISAKKEEKKKTKTSLGKSAFKFVMFKWAYVCFFSTSQHKAFYVDRCQHNDTKHTFNWLMLQLFTWTCMYIKKSKVKVKYFSIVDKTLLFSNPVASCNLGTLACYQGGLLYVLFSCSILSTTPKV